MNRIFSALESVSLASDGDADIWVKNLGEDEVGIGKMVEGEEEAKNGVEGAAGTEALKEEREKIKVAFKSLPLTSIPASKGTISHHHSRSFGKLVREFVPRRRFSKFAVHAPLILRPLNVPLVTVDNPGHSHRYLADFPISPDQVGPRLVLGNFTFLR